MVHRLVGTLALLIVSAWTLHTVVLGGDMLLAQHPIAMLRTVAVENQRQPPNGYRQAIVAAQRLLPANAAVAVSNRTNYRQNYAYYWATYKLYPLHVWVVDSTQAAAEGAPDYILDIRDAGVSESAPPGGYVVRDTRTFEGGIVMAVLGRA